MAATTNGVSPFTGPCHCVNDVGGGLPVTTDGWCTQGSDTIEIGCDAGIPLQCFYTSVTDFGNDHCNCTLRNTLADCEDICLTAGGAHVDQFCVSNGITGSSSSSQTTNPSNPTSSGTTTSNDGAEVRAAWKLMAGMVGLIFTGALFQQC